MPAETAEAHNSAGNTFLARGQLDQAADAYRRAIGLDPDLAEPHYNLGIASDRLGDLEQAAACYARAIRLKPAYAQAHLNLGSVYRRLGRLDEAVASYRRAIALRPTDPLAFNNLGNALSRLGRLDEAVAAFRQAASLRPDYVQAHYNLGVVLRDRGLHDEGAAAFRRVLALTPDHVEGNNNLGVALLALGKPEEAAESFRRALAHKPDHAAAHNNLGIAWLDQGRLDAAAAAFERAISQQPDFAKAHYNLGVVLQYQGRLQAAAQSLQRALTLKPDYAEAHYSLAAQGQEADGSPVAETALALIERQVETSGSLEPRTRSALLFALSKTLEGRGEFDRAFSAMAEANAIHRAGLSFDIAQAEQRMAETARLFDGAVFERLQGAGAPAERPVFIVGMPRSGTSLIEQIISAHPAVHGAGELANLTSLIGQAHGGAGLRPDAMTADAAAAFGQAYLDSLPPAAPGQSRMTDKAISNFEHLGLIHLCLPHAAIIHCRRDPRDVCLSCFATRFSAGQDFTYDLAELGRYWRAYDRLMDHWRRVLPPGRMLEVPYEALVDDLEGWSRRLIAHCGLEWDPACLRFHESGRDVRTASFAQVRRPIYASSVGRWRRFAPHLGPLLEALG